MPNQIHLLRRNIEASGFVLKFDSLFLESSKELLLFYNTVIFNQNFKPSQEVFILDEKLVIDLFNKLKENFNNKILSLSVLCFLTNLFDKSINAKESQSDLFIEFFKCLELNIKRERKVMYYINLLNINNKDLNKVVKKRTGMLTKEFIQRRLLLESKRLLFHSKLTVKEVAYELNFKEPAHFSNFFKKETGDYPLNFLNNLEK
jgi:AraC-like DNA-binding protein